MHTSAAVPPACRPLSGMRAAQEAIIAKKQPVSSFHIRRGGQGRRLPRGAPSRAQHWKAPSSARRRQGFYGCAENIPLASRSKEENVEARSDPSTVETPGCVVVLFQRNLLRVDDNTVLRELARRHQGSALRFVYVLEPTIFQDARDVELACVSFLRSEVRDRLKAELHVLESSAFASLLKQEINNRVDVTVMTHSNSIEFEAQHRTVEIAEMVARFGARFVAVDVESTVSVLHEDSEEKDTVLFDDGIAKKIQKRLQDRSEGTQAEHAWIYAELPQSLDGNVSESSMDLLEKQASQCTSSEEDSLRRQHSWLLTDLTKARLELSVWAYLSYPHVGDVEGVLEGYESMLSRDMETSEKSSSVELIQELWCTRDAIESFPPTEGTSFVQLFGRVLFEYGLLSPSRVWALVAAHQAYHQAEHSKSVPRRPVPPGLVGYIDQRLRDFQSTAISRETATDNSFYSQARHAIVAEEWYKHLAYHTLLKGRSTDVSRDRGENEGLRHAFGRWQGHLFHYMYTPSVHTTERSRNKRSILLVHGFGAFADQFVDVAVELASDGHNVFIPTIPGFGRSAKPAKHYTVESYLDFLRHFRVHVRHNHGHSDGASFLVGNSVGAYLSASFAAAFPREVDDLVLINSAGLVSSQTSTRRSGGVSLFPNPSWNEAGDSKLMGAHTSGRAAKSMLTIGKLIASATIKALYPVHPQRAEGWFTDELLRAAEDPGAWRLFQALLYLESPPTIDEILIQFGGRTLMIQVCASLLW
eukprot:scaffold2232_cov365-Prasinococcus_capsulatus_cf.AAC.7